VARPPTLPAEPVAVPEVVTEVSLLERARKEAKAQPETALKSITEYKQRFPTGQLRPQAEVVRLEALLRMGKRAEGENLGRKLIEHDPALKREVEQLLRTARPQ
jgi:hypothetical protein